jgi:alpha-glucosidase (family GH31 glycosyl hydrolase)
VFADFLNEKANDWWKNEFTKLREVLDFDGVWLDMNEAANFVTGNANPA